MNTNPIPASLFEEFKIQISDPLAEFLGGTPNESRFSISLLDVIHFSGHACPSVVGAFLMTQKAVELLYPDSKTLVRGDLVVSLPTPPAQGATGPIANVISYLTGAWGETGFGGIQGKFSRRDLLRFAVSEIPHGTIRFERISTKNAVGLSYDPTKIELKATETPRLQDFQTQWRHRIKSILEHPQLAIEAVT